MPYPLGKHWIIEFFGCLPGPLAEPVSMENIMEMAAKAMGATIVQRNFHHFSPLGVSGVIIIKESHLTIHTWPEFGYAAVDIFTCGNMDTEAGIQYLAAALQAESREVRLLERGFVLPKKSALDPR